MPIIWTKSKCLQEINKYEYKGDFMRRSPGAYAACKRNSWYIDKIEKLKVKLNRRWTKEQIIKLASKCKTRKEFIDNNKGAYLFALRRGWKEEIFKDIPSSFTYWDYKSCLSEARKYITKKEFRENSRNAYHYASEHKFLDDICIHMHVLGNEYMRMIYAYEFTDGHAYIGLTYNEKKRQYEHFYEKRGPVAKHIKKTGLGPKYIKLHDYVLKDEAIKLENKFINQYRLNGWKMLNGAKGGALGGNQRQWTLERCLQIAKDFNRKEDLRWAPGLGGLYNAANKNGWWDQICAHMTEGNTKWTKKEVLKAAKTCDFVGEFQKKFGAAFRAAKAGGYLEEVHSLLQTKIQYWNHESVEIEAKKYKRIVEFQKKNPGAYNYAHRNGLLGKVTKHMSKLTYWDLELCKQEAKKYIKKYDFMRYSASCYNYARKNGYLEEICSHMQQRKWNEKAFKKTR